MQYPLEAQIIATISQNDMSACLSSGCQVGISTLYELFDDPAAINMFLDSLIPYIPYNGAVRMLAPACMHPFPGSRVNLHSPCEAQYVWDVLTCSFGLQAWLAA